MRVYKEIKSQIVDKKYKVGTILPPEPSLEKEFGVSRTTVRKAVDMLVRDGFITVKQGFGTQVISRKAIQNLNRFTSISESLESEGKKIGLRSCYIERTAAPEEIAALLGVKPGTPVICLHRIKTSDDMPISICCNYILEQLVPGLESKGEIPHLYRYLNETYGIMYNRSHDMISACNATFEQSQLLAIEPKTALLSVKRVCYIGTRPCEVDIVHIIAEFYEYEVIMGALTE